MSQWFGKYRAFVRDNHDPERMGRLRLEISTVLGSGRENWSEWAAPCLPYGGIDDCGMFLIPEEGATVWAEFEGGQAEYPIWSGVWLAKSNPAEQPEESKRLCNKTNCQDCGDRLEHQANCHDNLEHKKYHSHPVYYCPKVKVLLKTETGHTILADDRDGSEVLKIIDRSGQCIVLESPVKPQLQTNNSLKRGIKEAGNGNQLDLSSQIVGQKARMQFTDLSGQKILLEAWQDKEKIHLVSGNRNQTRTQKILLDTTKGREKILIQGLNGKQQIVIDSTSGQEKITITDRAGQSIKLSSAPGRESISLTDKLGSRIFMDGLMGNIIIKAANSLILG